MSYLFISLLQKEGRLRFHSWLNQDVSIIPQCQVRFRGNLRPPPHFCNHESCMWHIPSLNQGALFVYMSEVLLKHFMGCYFKKKGVCWYWRSTNLSSNGRTRIGNGLFQCNDHIEVAVDQRWLVSVDSHNVLINCSMEISTIIIKWNSPIHCSWVDQSHFCL